MLLYQIQQDQYDDKNLKYHRWILQLGNVQKKQYIIMNIMYSILHLHITRKWKDKLFHETNSDTLSSCTDLPTARYTESEIIEVMNYLLYVFISSVCMYAYMYVKHVNHSTTLQNNFTAYKHHSIPTVCSVWPWQGMLLPISSHRNAAQQP